MTRVERTTSQSKKSKDEKKKPKKDKNLLEALSDLQAESQAMAVEKEQEAQNHTDEDAISPELLAEGLASENLGDSSEVAELEDLEEGAIPKDLEMVQVKSVIESLLLASEKPITISVLKEVFKGSNTTTDSIKRCLNDLIIEYTGAERGMSLSEVGGGYQLRTKSDNMVFVRRLTKGRPFKLSGPALEVLSIIAYKQPLIKAEVDSIRGVESGHLVRALMDRSLVKFVGKSEMPGKPMLYGTTRKFLEIFGLRDLRELPSLSEIDDLLPEGMDEDEAKPERDWGVINQMSMEVPQDTGREEEWAKITEQIAQIETSTDFFEQEKIRQKQERDRKKAEDIRDALLANEEVESKDKRWLARYEASLLKPVENTLSDLAQSLEPPETQPEAQPETQQEPLEASFSDDGQEKPQSETESEQEETLSIEELQKTKLEEALKDFDAADE
jgi:segregation and condensation protein B